MQIFVILREAPFSDTGPNHNHLFMNRIQTENWVLSLGSRHSVEHRNLAPQTREKVCVWCIFEPQ